MSWDRLIEHSPSQLMEIARAVGRIHSMRDIEHMLGTFYAVGATKGIEGLRERVNDKATILD